MRDPMRASMLASFFAAAAAVGCSATNDDVTFASGANGGSGTASGATGQGAGTGSSASNGVGGSFGAGGATGSGGSGAGCSAEAELVYVFSLDNDIWSFDPPSKKFTKIATPDCATGMQPNSMAID